MAIPKIARLVFTALAVMLLCLVLESAVLARESETAQRKRPVHKPYVREVFLGRSAIGADYARLEQTTGGQLCRVTVVLETRRKNKVLKRIVQNIGVSFHSTVKFRVVPITHTRRKDIFVSITHGAVTTRVFSYTRGTLKTLYEEVGGRVDVFLWPAKEGRFALIERWSLNQFQDANPEGGASVVTNFTVRRTLHWRRGRFIADETPAQRRRVHDAILERR